MWLLQDVAETAASDKDQDMDEASSGCETASDDGDRAAPGPGGRQAEQAQRPVDGAAGGPNYTQAFVGLLTVQQWARFQTRLTCSTTAVRRADSAGVADFW